MVFDYVKRLSFDRIRTNSVFGRTNLVTIRNMARPYEDPLPEWKMPAAAASEFDQLVNAIIDMRLQNKPVIWSMGAHVIKNGLSRYIIEMVRHGFLTHVSGNGATSIHDFELALLGETSEDVARSIEDGSFGMWEETGGYMNAAIQRGVHEGLGYGESLYRYLSDHPDRFPHYHDCVFVQCQRSGVPYTCHISIGTDIIHQHPMVNFEALGAASGRDFKTICSSISEMDNGGIFLNFGSAISGPEIFLKSLSLARNAGLSMRGITAANFDIVPVYADRTPPIETPEFHYRPRRVLIDRLEEIGGKGYLFHGLHQITIPHLFHALWKRKTERGLHFSDDRPEESGNKLPLTLYSTQDRERRLAARELPALDPTVAMPWNPPEFADLVHRVIEANHHGKPMLVSLGGNVIGSEVNQFLCDLIRRRWISHVAVVGAAAAQEIEFAMFGHVNEYENGALAEGKLGMWREPAEIIHAALKSGYERGLGYGDSLKDYMEQHPHLFPYKDHSVLYHCLKANIPYTVHITIGVDAIQQHPETDFAIQGGASGWDFQSYCHTMSELEGGVFLNFGSTVTGPEVFLKALSIVRNLGFQVHHITTANFDIVRLGDYHKKVGYEDWDYYYRPRKNITHRPTSLGGKGFHFEGKHRETIPALWQAITRNVQERSEST